MVLGLTRMLMLICQKNTDENISVIYLAEPFILGLFAATLLCVISKSIAREGLGMGDVKLLVSLGFFLGLKTFLQALLLIAFLAFIVGLIYVAFKHADRKTTLPFAPLIMCGVVVTKIIEIIMEET